MNVHDATEYAYKNGYKMGKKETAKKILVKIEDAFEYEMNINGSDCILMREIIAELKKEFDVI